MRVAIVGGGVSGLANARVLRARGVDVTLYEARSDVGGVWSATRGYPGQRTQNDKRSYAFSDFPMPASAAEHPDRAQVQAYLAAYARHHALDDAIRLSTTVTAAEWADGVWRLTLTGPNGSSTDEADRLILANGIHSVPSPPDFTGIEAFETAGGRLVDASAVGERPDVAGKHVVVVGFGKSGADVAVAAAQRGALVVSVIARRIPWKLPYRIGRLPFQRLMITRLGEHLLWTPYRTPAGRVVRRLDLPLRRAFRSWLAQRIQEQSELDLRGMVPQETIKALTHLETHGLGQAIDERRVRIRAGRRVVALESGDDGPMARLDDGAAVRADLVVMATGYDQDLSFLDARTRSALLDAGGRLRLYRHTIATEVPHLAFAGWTNSFRSPLVAEVQASWIASYLAGALPQPACRQHTRQSVVLQLSHANAAKNRQPQFSDGLTILEQDRWLIDLGHPPTLRTLLRELVTPVDPSRYAFLHGDSGALRR